MFRTPTTGVVSQSAGAGVQRQRPLPGGGGLALPPAGLPINCWDMTALYGTLYSDLSGETPANVGDPVGVIADSGSQGIAAIALSLPARGVLQSGIGGIAFNGSSTTYRASVGTRTQPETLYLAVDRTTTNTERWSGSVVGNSLAIYSVSTNWYAFSGSGAGEPLTGIALAPTVACVVFNSTQSVIRANGAERLVNAGTTGGQNLEIGSFSQSSQFVTGRIMTVMRYAVAHDAATREAMEAWLAMRYGMTLPE